MRINRQRLDIMDIFYRSLAVGFTVNTSIISLLIIAENLMPEKNMSTLAKGISLCGSLGASTLATIGMFKHLVKSNYGNSEIDRNNIEMTP